MQLVRYQTPQDSPRLGLLENGQVYDLEATSGGRAAGGDMRAFLAQGRQVVDEVAAAGRKGPALPETTVRLLSPIANPGKLIAVAGGYYASEGAERLGRDALPLLFAKRTDDIKGPGDPITIWRISPGVVDEIEVAMKQSRCFALLATLLDFVPGFAEKLYVGADLVVRGAAGRSSNDEAAGIGVSSFADQTAQTRAVFRGDNLA